MDVKPCCPEAVYHSNPTGSAPFYTCPTHDRIRALEAERDEWRMNTWRELARAEKAEADRDAMAKTLDAEIKRHLVTQARVRELEAMVEEHIKECPIVSLDEHYAKLREARP